MHHNHNTSENGCQGTTLKHQQESSRTPSIAAPRVDAPENQRQGTTLKRQQERSRVPHLAAPRAETKKTSRTFGHSERNAYLCTALQKSPSARSGRKIWTQRHLAIATACQRLQWPLSCKASRGLSRGVMVTLQFLVLSFSVRIRAGQLIFFPRTCSSVG